MSAWRGAGRGNVGPWPGEGGGRGRPSPPLLSSPGSFPRPSATPEASRVRKPHWGCEGKDYAFYSAFFKTRVQLFSASATSSSAPGDGSCLLLVICQAPLPGLPCRPRTAATPDPAGFRNPLASGSALVSRCFFLSCAWEYQRKLTMALLSCGSEGFVTIVVSVLQIRKKVIQ